MRKIRYLALLIFCMAYWATSAHAVNEMPPEFPAVDTEYAIRNTCGDLYLNITAFDGVRISNQASPITFIPSGDGYLLKSGDNYVGMHNGWAMNNYTQTVWTLNPLGDGKYTLQGPNGLIGTDSTADGSVCYGDKQQQSNNAVWVIEVWTDELGQYHYNPFSPDEPGVAPQKLNLMASPADGGSVSGGGRYVPGTTRDVIAYANADWTFTAWKDAVGNVLSTDRYYIHTKQEGEETLTACFEFAPGSPADPVPGTQLVYYCLTTAADGGGTASGGGRYRSGADVWLRAQCYENFEFVGWVNEKGETVSTSQSFSYQTQSFNETLTATFRFNPSNPNDPDVAIVHHRLYVTTPEGGTVSGGGLILEGTSVTLRANANTGYKFLGWYQGGELYTSLPTFNWTMGSENVAFEARFEFNPSSPAEPAMPVEKHYAIYLMSPITYPGRDVECQVYLSNLSPLGDMHFDLTFPEGMVPDMDGIVLGASMGGYSVSATATEEPNVYNITLHGGTAMPGNKRIFRIPLSVPETTALGTDYQLKINQVSVTQEDGSTCTTSTRNGRVSVYKQGDTNGDGVVNILDRINLVGYVGTGWAEEDTFIREVSDINEDGNFTILDVIGISDIIANE